MTIRLLASGQYCTYAAGRLTNVTYADGKQDSFTYDTVGNLLTYSNESASGTLTYDALNRKLSEDINYGLFTNFLASGWLQAS